MKNWDGPTWFTIITSILVFLLFLATNSVTFTDAVDRYGSVESLKAHQEVYYKMGRAIDNFVTDNLVAGE